MGMSRTPPRAALAVVRGRRCSRALVGAAPAAADAGKVLVFTGTAGTAERRHARPPPPRSTRSAAANDFTVDATATRRSINAAKLAGYRAVVFVQLVGRRAQRRGGSRSPELRAGRRRLRRHRRDRAARAGQRVLRHADRPDGRRAHQRRAPSSATDVEFLDRVHPATKALPMLLKAHSDAYYTWTNNPTGLVHTVARVRCRTSRCRTARRSPTTRVSRFTGATSANQPQGEAPVSWCRDIQQRPLVLHRSRPHGRSVLRRRPSRSSSSAPSVGRGPRPRQLQGDDQLQLPVTRLSPPNPTTPTSNPYVGEIDGIAIATDGRVFYTGRAVCSAGMTRSSSNWTLPNVGLGCGTIHVWDRTPGRGHENQDAAKVTKVGDLHGLRRQGRGNETGVSSKDEQGLLASPWTRSSPTGRPYFYVQYHPYYNGEQGVRRAAAPSSSARLRPQPLHGRAPALALHVRQRDQDDRAPAPRRSSCTG